MSSFWGSGNPRKPKFSLHCCPGAEGIILLAHQKDKGDAGWQALTSAGWAVQVRFCAREPRRWSKEILDLYRPKAHPPSGWGPTQLLKPIAQSSFQAAGQERGTQTKPSGLSELNLGRLRQLELLGLRSESGNYVRRELWRSVEEFSPVFEQCNRDT